MPDRFQLGIASWTLPWAIGVKGYPPPPSPLGWMGLLDKAVEFKASVVQIADNLPLHELPDHELDALRQAARARDLALEAGTRGLDPDHLTNYIAIAHRIGARILRTVLSGSLLGGDQLLSAEASVQKILPRLEEAGVTLAIENNEAFSAAEFAALIERLNSPRVGICLDTANSLGRPETLKTVVEALAPHAIELHAKDYDIRRIDTRMGFAVVGTAAGQGRVDFGYVLAELSRHARGRMNVIVEHWPPFAGTIEQTVLAEQVWLEESVAFLRKKLSEF
jgi:3-oxoisoapionate decarboxylase